MYKAVSWKSKMQYSQEDIDYLLSPLAIRDRAGQVYDLVKSGRGSFELHEEKLPEVAEFVLDTIRKNYPDLKIPFHSRWGHFQVGKVDRVGEFNQLIKDQDRIEKVRTQLDLVITSVLLDAGAGPSWSYFEESTQQKFSRSEGLGVASLYMFLNGYFSGEKDHPLRADGQKLMLLSEEDLCEAFQVNDGNPLVGVTGRVNLIRSLGKVVTESSEFFPKGRPGSLVDHLITKHGESFSAVDVLNAVLRGLGDIWPGRLALGETNLGDVWTHTGLGTAGETSSLVAFHKLSQWLTYSLLEPMMDAGLNISGVEKLTGLAEYRNGGLLVDKGLVSLVDESALAKAHKPESDLIIEWRALTIVYLDRIANLVREKLEFSEEEFPLAKVLEGGTWWAGRFAAKALREDGSPPIKIDSDGTVF